jgi:hypothetical protein
LALILNNHDRIKSSTEIRLFFGCREKDSITASLLIDRVEKAAQIVA